METISCAEDSRVQYYDASCQIRRSETFLKQGYEQSKQDIHHEKQYTCDESSYATSDEEKDRTDNEKKKQTRNYPGSDADIDDSDNESIKERPCADVGADTDVEGDQRAMFVANENNLECVDWDRFYNTGELLPKKDCQDGSAEDLLNVAAAMKQTQNTDGWKKRLVPY